MKVNWQSNAPSLELKVPSEVRVDGYIPTSEDLTFSGDCSWLFSNNKFNWLVEQYPVKITQCNNAYRMFCGSTNLHGDISKTTIQLTNCETGNGMLLGIGQVQGLPKVSGEITYNISSLFQEAKIQEIPNDWFDNISFSNIRYASQIFYGCTNLVKCPPLNWLKKINFSSNARESWYYYLFYNCRQITEITNIPCIDLAQFNYNQLRGLVGETYKLKKLTFEMDGQQVKWANQTLSLDDHVGYSGYETSRIFKSVYNHDSAVETINSLPDTSAYLATAGGTNTIYFTGNAGSATEGGAINTMTPEEIAVATAKGWTVTFA